MSSTSSGSGAASRPKTPRPKMSMEERAAQFMPFAALTGYYDLIGKTDANWDAEHVAADFAGLPDDELPPEVEFDPERPENTVRG